MSDIANYLQNKLVGHTFCKSTFTPVNTYYAALATTITTLTDTVVEVPTGTAYARQVITFGAVGDGKCYNNNGVQFPAATTPWGTIGWVAIYDASTGGNLILRKNVDSPAYVYTGVVFSLGYNQLSIQMI